MAARMDSKVLFVFIYLELICLAQPEIFTSLAEFQKLIEVEAKIAEDIDELIQEEEERLAYLKRLRSDYSEHSHAASSDSESFLSNPVNAYRLVKRFTSDWRKVARKLRRDGVNEFVERVSTWLAGLCGDLDLVGSARALLRIQDTYTIATENIAKGDLPGVEQAAFMDASDCFELGRVAYEAKDYYHSILWFQQALVTMETEYPDDVTKALTLDYLAYSHYAQGNTYMAWNLTMQWLEIEPDNKRALDNLSGYEDVLTTNCSSPVGQVVRNARNLYGYRAGETFENYERLCRGEVQVHNSFAPLSCRFARHHPYYILRPLKEEPVHLQPDIYVYHDLILETEMAVVKDIASPMLETSGVFDAREDISRSNPMVDARVSKSAWVSDDAHWLLRRISNKIEAATGLSTSTAESFQVLNYGLGGQYEPHMDYAQVEDDVNMFPHFREFGNRISTTLCYISEVAAGGATVFPHLGLQVVPEKGSVVHWYNLLRSGHVDPRTVHAGCPVLSGSKWVCNKWIHERGQEFRRPCSLNPEE